MNPYQIKPGDLEEVEEEEIQDFDPTGFNVVGVTEPEGEIVDFDESQFTDFQVKPPEVAPVPAPVEEGVSLNQQDLASDPIRLDKIRKMMVQAKGSDYHNKPAEDVVSDFMTHMRLVNGNEGYTLKEALDVYRMTDEEKQTYGEAYKVFDEVGNMFTNGTWGDLGEGVADYAYAVATSPSTWAGAIVGKAFGRAGTKVAQEGIKKAIQQATKKGVTETAAKQTVVKLGSKIQAKKAIIGSVGTEMAFAAGQDTLYQDLMMETGVQDDYSAMQGAITIAAAGAVGLVSPLIASRSSGVGVSGMGGVDQSLEIAKQKSVRKINDKVQKEVADKLRQRAVDWLDMAEKGQNFEPNKGTRDDIVKFFFDVEDENSFVRMIGSTGSRIPRLEDMNFTQSVMEFAEGLDEASREALDNALEPMGLRFRDVMNIAVATAREGGQNANMISQAAKFADNIALVGHSNNVAAEGIMAAAKEADEIGKEAQSPETIRYIQSIWKRALVSNIGTTVMNVKGWTMAQSTRSMAQLMQAGGMYGKAGVEALMLKGDKSKVSLGKANAYLQNLNYLTKVAVDPFTTVDGFYKLLEQAPKNIQGKVSAQFFSGVDTRGASAFGLNPDSKGSKFAEGYLQKAQNFAFVNAQDVMTKSISGTVELDKQSRLQLGKGLADLIADGELDRITPDMWEKSVRALQDTTFSRDFSRDKGFWPGAAKIVQNVSRHEMGGFVIPFGQFANSVVHFAHTYGPTGFISSANKYWKGAGEEEIGESLSRAMVGTTFMYTMYQREKGKQEEGLQWNQERDDNGDIIDITNEFPRSFYNAIGRFFADPTKDTLAEVGKQLVIPDAMNKLGDDAILQGVAAFASDLVNGEADKGLLEILGDAGLGVTAGGAKIAGGFLRPFDTVNDLAGIGLEGMGVVNNDTVDKKQITDPAQRAVVELTTYVDTAFKMLIGEDSPEGKRLGPAKQTSTQSGPVRPGNEVTALFGHKVEQRSTNIDKLLGQVNKPAWKADNLTTGVPEYDAWMNENITPILERNATALLNNKFFKEAPQDVKANQVNRMLKDARTELLSSLEGNLAGRSEAGVLKKRRDIMAAPEGDRQRAAKQLGITVDVSKMNYYQLEQMSHAMKLENELFDSRFKY